MCKTTHHGTRAMTLSQGAKTARESSLTQRGVTLIELNLALSVGAVLLISWVAVLAHPLAQLEGRLHQGRKNQHFYQLATWLQSDLTRAVDNGAVNWQWDPASQCLLYGPQAGIRVREQQLQWRGGERGCNDSHWQNLNDAQHAAVLKLRVSQSTGPGPGRTYVRLYGQAGEHALQWSIRLDGELALEPLP